MSRSDEVELTQVNANVAPLPSRQVSRTAQRHSELELHICLPDLTHVTLTIDQRTQATEIMDSVIEMLELNAREARHVLSLWLVSSDLELQLKPNHCPVQLFGKWPVYLRKHTTVSEKLIQTQQPYVHLRRNVYISREEDLKVTDPEILELLFTEARSNIMNGTYPCDRELAVKLAGVLCVMQYGPYNELEHTPDYYKSLHSLFPLSIQSNSKLHDEVCKLFCFTHKSFDPLEQSANADHERVEKWYKAYLDAVHTLPYYGANQAALLPVLHLNDLKSLIPLVSQSHVARTHSLLNNPPAVDLRLTYISECSESLPFYGSVFFDGFIERSGKSFLHSSWLAVSIGANTDGIFVISTEKQEPVFGIQYEDLTWECISGEDKESGIESQKPKSFRKDKVKSLPSLLLQFAASSSDQEKGISSQVLRIYTKSARLIDAFIETCTEIVKVRLQSSPIPSPGVNLAAAGDAVDGLTFSPSPTLNTESSHNSRDEAQAIETLERSIRSMTKPEKLTCLSFNKDSKCVSP